MGRSQEQSLELRSHLGCLTLLGSTNEEAPFLIRTARPQHLPCLVIRNPRSQESVFLKCHLPLTDPRKKRSCLSGPKFLVGGTSILPHPQYLLPTLSLLCQCLCFPCSVGDLLIVKLLHLLMCSEQGPEPLGSKRLHRLLSPINTQGREAVGGFQESVYFELCLMQKQGSQRKDVRFNVCVALPISNNRSCC